MERASADVGLMMTAYNLRRIINILGMQRITDFLQDRIALFLSKTAALERILAHMLAYLLITQYWNLTSKLPVKQLHSIQIPTPGRGF